MKSYHFTLAAAVFAAFTLLVQPAIAAEKAAEASGQSVRFGILNLDRVLQDSDAAKGIMAELNAKRKEYEAQITKEEKSLLSAEEEIRKQKSKMTEEEFGKKRTEFEKKLTNAKKMVQDRKGTLDNAFNTSMKKLREESLKITAEIARDRNFDIVFSDDAIVLAESAYDITDEVLARLNKDVKKIAVVWKK